MHLDLNLYNPRKVLVQIIEIRYTELCMFLASEKITQVLMNMISLLQVVIVKCESLDEELNLFMQSN